MVTSYDRDNLEVVTQDIHITSGLQLESGSSVVRGEVLKKGTTGLIPIAATSDDPYCIAWETVDATDEAKDISYMLQGAVLNSALTYGAGDITNFRDKFVTATKISVREK